MTRSTFDWDESTWTRDYRADFATFKEALINSMDLVFPDFSLTWILLTDASDYAVGWVLIQLRPTEDGIKTEVTSVVTYLRYRVRNTNYSGSRWVCV